MAPIPSPQGSSIMFLLQTPRKWRSRHFKALNLLERIPAHPEEIVGKMSLPGDGEKEFEKLAGQFASPMDSFYPWHHATDAESNNPFIICRGCINALKIKNGDQWTDPRLMLDFFFEELTSVVKLKSYFIKSLSPEIWFTIPGLQVKALLRCRGGAFFRRVPEGYDLPAMIYRVLKDDDTKDPKGYEVAQIFTQAICCYASDPTVPMYPGFSITMQGSVVHVSCARIYNSYIQALCLGRSSGETLKFRRSRPYDLTECEGRREFLRLMLGILNFRGLGEG